MLIPLLCIIFALNAIELRLRQYFIGRHQYKVQEILIDGVSPLMQSLIIWSGFIILAWSITYLVNKKISESKRFYATPVLQILSCAAFTCLLPYAHECAFKALSFAMDFLLPSDLLDHRNNPYELSFIKEWLFLIPFIGIQLIIMIKPGLQGGGSSKRNFSSALRFQLLLIAPYIVIRPLFDLIQFTENREVWNDPWVNMPLMLFVIFAMVGFAPSLLKFVMKTKVLPESEVRDELLGMAKELKIKFSSLRLWKTGGQINAAVVGTLPSLRFLVITEGMLNTFSLTEIRQVFWHEFGHIKHKHMWIYFLFFSCITNLAILIDYKYYEVLQTASYDWVLPVMVFACWGIGFSFLSRRLERQADFFALTHSEDPELFVAVLKKLSYVTGIPYKFYSLTHGSIQQRVTFLEAVLQDPTKGDRFNRALALWLRLLFFACACEWIMLLKFYLTHRSS